MTSDPTSTVRPAGGRRRGPNTVAGKARSARNALKHGLRARVLVLVDGEDAADFAAFEAAVRAELAPVGALQGDLVARIVTAAWRARRADRMEAALLRRYVADVWPGDGTDPQVALGYGLLRDGNGPRVLETLLRYRGSVLAELFRSLAALEARQAQNESAAAAPAMLELRGATTKRIPKRKLKQSVLRSEARKWYSGGMSRTLTDRDCDTSMELARRTRLGRTSRARAASACLQSCTYARAPA